MEQPVQPPPALNQQVTLSQESIRDTFERVYRDFDRHIQTITEHRAIRKNQVNIKQLRENKQLQPDETYVAVRVIDENIARDMPTYLAYIKQSTRLAIFRRRDGAVDQRLGALEDWFTAGLSYADPAWEIDYIKWIDGALCHGRDYVEVVYDVAKPAYVAVNHVGADRLIYDLNFDDIQQSPLVARGYRLGPVELRRFKDTGLFNSQATDALLTYIDQTKRGQSADAYDAPTAHKIYVKLGGTVYFCWYSNVIKQFLTEPKPFFNGIYERREVVEPVLDPQTFSLSETTRTEIVPANEQLYPFVPLHRKITEDANQYAATGHAHDSYYLQEAATTMMTSLINGSINASKTMWAPDSANGLEGSNPRQINFQIERNAIWAQPMRSFSPPYPDPMLINTLQFLETRNGIATNQTAFAVANRKDSRKTATELSLAQSQTSQVNSVQVLHLSIAVRDVAMRAWAIVRSAVLANNLVLPPHIDRDLFDYEYTLASAGDVDYVQRNQLIANMQQDWPILSGTPIGPLLLEDYIKARYPSDAPRYIAALRQQQQDTNLIQGLATVLQELATDENGQLTAEAQANAQSLQQLQQLVVQRLAQPGGMGNVAPPSGNAGAPAQPVA